MTGIRIVLHLVRCTQSLLICDDIDTASLRFQSMTDCEQQRPALIAALGRAEPNQVVMGRCRVLVLPVERGQPDGHAGPSG